MGNPTGFMQFPRAEIPQRAIEQRVRDFHEIGLPLADDEANRQAARCMDCGIPFCHGAGCPVVNRIPEFNDLIYRQRWRDAAANLHSTNNFPEFTGRICPAPCEAACTLAINDDAVTIKQIEYLIAERAFDEGWVTPVRPEFKSGKKIAIVGSGPAGLAAAQQLARAGHEVLLYEKDDRLGGLLRYGIPDFKLEKRIIDRRMEQMAAEGVKFQPNVNVGQDVSGPELKRTFDAVCLCMGAGEPRPLDVPGADLDGVHYAMEFLTQQNRRVAGDSSDTLGKMEVRAKGKRVVVIGGGDTGSDCVGTSVRQGADSIHQLEILPQPPEDANPDTPWPLWPQILRTSTSHQEGCRRRWSVLTKELIGHNGRVTGLGGCEVDWRRGPKGWQMKERPGTDFSLEADLVLLGTGFLHVVRIGVIEQLGVELDQRGNVKEDNWMSSVPGVFVAGDTRRGASLVVHAVNEGRQAAAAIDRWLKTGSD